MRKDMKDIVVDTGRRYWGSKKSRRKDKLRKDLNRAEHEEVEASSNSPKKYEYTKDWSFGDRLSPLYRWLDKQVGRQWDEVYSEFCEKNDRRNIRGWHLHTHLDQMVQVKEDKESWNWYPYKVEGGVLKRKRIDPGANFPNNSWKPKEDPDVVRVGDLREVRKIDGVWYEVELDSIDPDGKTKSGKRKDVVTKKSVFSVSGDPIRYNALYQYVPPMHRDDNSKKAKTRAFKTSLFAINKQQLGKKKLKEYGLK